MLSSALVVIPLKDIDYSSGQAILINAMALRKCVIITEATWSKDYLVHGCNAWLVPPRDAKKLSEAINLLLRDVEKRNRIGVNARKYHD